MKIFKLNRALGLVSAVLMLTGLIQSVQFSVASTEAAQAVVSNATCSSSMTAQNGLQAVPSHGQVMYVDTGVTPKVDAAYVGYQITNASSGGATNRKDIWVSLENFTGGKVSLANDLDKYQQIPTLNTGTYSTAYYLLKAQSSTTLAQQHTVKVYDRRPDLQGAITLLTCDFKFVKVAETIKASANKVNTVTKSASPTVATLGGKVTVSVTSAFTGKLGQGSAPDNYAFWSSPAGVSSWPTRALRLESVSITIACQGSTSIVLTNQLFISSANTSSGLGQCVGGNGQNWTAAYVFRIIGPGPAALTPAPVAFISSGTQYKHSDLNGITSQSIDLSGVVSSSISVRIDASGTQVAATANAVTVRYTVTMSTTSTVALSVDEIVATHDAGTSLVSGSVKLNGVSVSDPTNLASDVGIPAPPMHFVGPYSAVSGASAVLVYDVTIPCASTSATYSAKIVAYSGDVLIGASATATSVSAVTTQSSGSSCTYTVVNTTVSMEPTVSTAPADAITSSTANINGYVNPAGNSGVTYRLVHSTDPNLVSGVTSGSWGSITGSTPLLKTDNLSALSPATTYYFRAEIKNSLGVITQGAVLSFTTAAVQATPSVQTVAAGPIATTSATFNGSINPNLTPITQVVFLYGTDSTLTTSTSTSAIQMDDGTGTLVNMTLSGSGTTQVSQVSPTLLAATTYYFRVKASCTVNATYCPLGYVLGGILSFTTGAPTVATNEATSVGSTTATLNGVVTSTANNVNAAFVYCLAGSGCSSTQVTTGAVTTTSQVLNSPNAASVSDNLTGLTAGATYYFQVKASVASVSSYGAIYSFTTLAITTTSLPNGSVGAGYTASLSGVGGSNTYSWSIDPSDPLPAGLSLSTSGVVTGTPTSPGQKTVTVILTDPVTGLTVSKQFTFSFTAAITYVGNGNTSGSAPSVLTTSAASVNLADNSGGANGTLAKSGYSFGGWTIQSQTYAAGGAYTVTTNVTATAIWNPLTYVVTYDPNTATGSALRTSDSFTVGSSSAITLPTVGSMANGTSTFGGWSLTQQAGSLTVSDPYIPSGTVTLYAVWVAAGSYSVTFNANDGSGNPALAVQTSAGSANLVANAFVRTGYHFVNWATNANGTGTTYADGANFGFTSNAILYAIWAGDQYTVTYDANAASGSASRTSDSFTVGSSSAITLPTVGSLSKTGYSFGGWSLTAGTGGSGGVVLSGAFTPTATVTLYAVWVADTYTVTYDANTASGSASRTSDSFTVGSSSAITLPTVGSLSKTGYSFGGWSLTAGASGSGGVVLSGAYTPTATVTLYAVWVAAGSYSVVFNANDGSGSPAVVTQSSSVAANLIANTFVRSGYVFVNWATNTDGTGTTYADGANFSFATSITVYAIWSAITAPPSPSPTTPTAPPVVLPAPPVVLGGLGSTISTLPATIVPQVTGVGARCLVDPADQVCKQSVTLPGKGTFVLNQNGTVTFVPVSGFVGTATVILRVTDSYGQIGEGPVTVTVSATTEAREGSTTGQTPVVFIANLQTGGSSCLVDPNQSDCAQKIEILDQGTWAIPKYATVSFRAARLFIGTSVIILRTTYAKGNVSNIKYSASVGKVRMPVTVTIGGFKPGSPILTDAIKKQIKAFMDAYVDYKKIECIGYTMGPTVLSVDNWLSKTRATNACQFVSSNLKRKLIQMPLKNAMQTKLGERVRRVTLTLRD